TLRRAMVTGAVTKRLSHGYKTKYCYKAARKLRVTNLASLVSGTVEELSMSTETIKHPPLVTDVRTGRNFAWLKQFWAGLLAGKKKLLIGGGGMLAVVLVGFYFWGDNTGTAQYLTARVDRGNLRNTVTATGTLQA